MRNSLNTRWNPSKTLTNNIEEFKKIISEFRSLEDKLNDENEAYVLINSQPESYKEVENTLKYGRLSKN